MGFVTDLADAASSLLGGGDSAAAEMKKATPIFHKADPVMDPEGNAPNATALQNLNVYDPKLPIEFIHFGFVHADTHDGFPNDPVLDDSKKDALKDRPAATRGVMFRAALDREALLLHGFISSVKSVLQESKDNEGGLGELADSITSLATGGQGAGAGSDPGQLDPYLKGVETAGGKINKEGIKYAEIHQAGMDLHQVRANYNAFMPDLVKGAAGGGGSSVLGNLPGALPLPSLPGVGDAINTVMGIVFKMFEFHKAICFKLRDKYEPAIEKACYERTMAAIRERYAPVFDVWSIQPEDDSSSAQADLITTHTGVSPVDDAIDGVNDAYRDAMNAIEEAKKKWEEFWGTPPPPGPGEAQLKAVFAAVDKPEEVVYDAFSEVMKISELPGFLKTAIAKITRANLGMLEAVYLRLQDPAVAKNLDDAAMMAAGRSYLQGVLKGLLSGLLPGFDFGPVSQKMVTGKAADMADDLVGEHLEPIIGLCMASLRDQLDEIRKATEPNHSLTMEVFLARMPVLLALMIRNSLFPVWQTIVDLVFGKVGGVAGMVTSPVKKLMDTGRNAASDLKKKAEELDADIKNKANDMSSDVKDKANDVSSSIKDKEHGVTSTLAGYGVTAGSPLGGAADSVASAVGGASDGLAGAVGGLADSILGTASNNAPPATFPGSDRCLNGTGKTIEKPEWKEVNDKQTVTPV